MASKIYFAITEKNPGLEFKECTLEVHPCQGGT